MTPTSGMVIGRKYRLDNKLASGGMGAIWRATHIDLDVEVAVKLVSEDLAGDETVQARFKREAKAAAQLTSPHVAHIHDYGLVLGTAYIVMELLKGEDLRAHLLRVGRLPLERCVEIVTPVCSALQLAHEAGIVHRDLKPGNIFLARSGKQEVVKVLDFGIAKETRSQLVVDDGTTTGVLIGSPRYMSPEQAIGDELDGRSDLWSVAVVAYEMITGQRPFLGDHVGLIISQICDGTFAPPSSLVDGLGSEIDDFFNRALAHEPDDRFQNAADLAEAFAAVAGGKPLPSRALPRAQRPAIGISGSRPSAGGVSGRTDRTDTFAADEASDPRAASTAEPDATAAEPAARDATTEETTSVFAKQGDATTPGIGIDSGRGKPAGRSALLAVIAVAAVVGVAAWLAGAEWGRSSQDSSVASPPSGTATATLVDTAAPPVATLSAAAPAASPSASATASAAPSAAPRAGPRLVAPRPTPAKPKSTASSKTDPLFGLPSKKKNR